LGGKSDKDSNKDNKDAKDITETIDDDPF
jgi:hypothetical protein